MNTYYSYADKADIAALLIGRRVTKVAADTLELDDGTILRLVGNDGGCSCSAGCYDLAELNDADNVITDVSFEDTPGIDYADGRYSIFVFAAHKRITLARFEGTDGNGYYGTGYRIEVTRP